VAQKTWNHAVQERVSVAAAVIGHLKEVHMLGSASGASALLQKWRLREVGKSHIYRRLMSWILVLCQYIVLRRPLECLLTFPQPKEPPVRHARLDDAYRMDSPLLTFTSVRSLCHLRTIRCRNPNHREQSPGSQELCLSQLDQHDFDPL
jgi:hypothetical protein